MPVNLYPIINPVEVLATTLGTTLAEQGVMAADHVHHGAGKAAQIAQHGISEAPAIVVGLLPDIGIVRAKGGNTTPGPGMGVTVLATPPGASAPEPMVLAARAIWTIQPQAEIVIYGRAPEGEAEPAEPRSHESADKYELSAFQILCRVLTALHEMFKTGCTPIGAHYAEPTNREWQYGSVIRLVVAIDVAVPDWARWQLTADEATGLLYQTKDLSQQGTEGGGWQAPPAS